MSRRSLVRILREHGIHAYTSHGHIFAWDVYSTLDHKLVQSLVELKPSIKVIRDFLGY